jgi:hypothetical protein
MASMLARYMRDQPVCQRGSGCLLEGVVVQTMMLSVALDEKFDAYCFILDNDNRGLGSEINYIPRRLILSLFAF